MPKYVYRRPRGYRSHKPSYTVNRKFCRNLTWNRLTQDSDIYTSAVQLVYNPSVESSNQLGTILTVKHLEVQLQDLPTYYGLNQEQNIVGHGTLAGGGVRQRRPSGAQLVQLRVRRSARHQARGRIRHAQGQVPGASPHEVHRTGMIDVCHG